MMSSFFLSFSAESLTTDYYYMSGGSSPGGGAGAVKSSNNFLSLPPSPTCAHRIEAEIKIRDVSIIMCRYCPMTSIDAMFDIELSPRKQNVPLILQSPKRPTGPPTSPIVTVPIRSNRKLFA